MIELIPMTEGEFDAYAADSVPRYAQDKVRAGQWTQEQSVQMAAATFKEYLPNRLKTPDNFLYRVRDSSKDADVGILWFAIKERGGKKVAFICDISVRSEHRRAGYGRLTLSALEKEARARGLAGIGLHVFGHNPAAQALYDKSGFRATSISMYKGLD
jgi:ribosomal protein S18 acetylase RimI-like enzyme